MTIEAIKELMEFVKSREDKNCRVIAMLETDLQKEKEALENNKSLLANLIKQKNEAKQSK